MQLMAAQPSTFNTGLSGEPSRRVDCSVCTALCTDLAPAPSPLYTNTSLHMSAAKRNLAASPQASHAALWDRQTPLQYIRSLMRL